MKTLSRYFYFNRLIWLGLYTLTNFDQLHEKIEITKFQFLYSYILYFSFDFGKVQLWLDRDFIISNRVLLYVFITLVGFKSDFLESLLCVFCKDFNISGIFASVPKKKKKLNIAFDRVNSINLCVNLSLLFFFTLSFCNFTVWLKALLDWFFVSTNWFSIVCIAIKFYVCFLVICNTIIVWIFKDIQSNTIIVKNFKIWPLPLKLIKHYFHKTITIFFLWKTLWHCYTSS